VTALAEGQVEILVGKIAIEAGIELAKIVCSFLDHYAGKDSGLEDADEVPPSGQ
jgi:hypothetical protein